jgi:SAM-dependent methyltransferase
LFGAEAELYDRVRPAYPPELVDDVVALVGLPTRAVDVGAGTGKATVMLAERGVTGVAVEPDPKMARVAARRLADSRGWRVDSGEFERWRPSSGESEFDLITAAHSWHWIGPEAGVRQAEELLRPGGWFAIWRYEHVRSGSALEEAIWAAYVVHAPELAGGRVPPWRTVPLESGFGQVLERSYLWCGEYSADAPACVHVRGLLAAELWVTAARNA